MNRWQWALYVSAYNVGRLVRWLRGNEEFHTVERQSSSPHSTAAMAVTLEDELDALIAQLDRSR